MLCGKYLSLVIGFNFLMATFSSPRRTLNGLVTPEGAALRHPDYADAFDLTEHFKFALLGIPHPSSSQANYNSPDMKKPAERMNNFLSTLYEYT